MSDRVVDSDAINTGEWNLVYRSKATGQQAGTEGPTTLHATRYRRQRAPTGGRATPKVEKPFTNGTVVVTYPTGTLVRDLQNGYIYTSTGPHSNAYTMRDHRTTLRGTLQFPMATGAKFPSPQSASFYPPGVNPDLLSQTEVKALNKLKGKSAEDQLSFGLMLAESRETSKLFADGAMALVKLAQSIKAKDPSAAMDVFLNDFRLRHVQGKMSEERLLRQTRRGVRTSMNLLETMSSLTLMWNLGLSPLLRDLDTAKTLLQTGLLTKDWNIKSVSRYSRQLNDRDETQWPATGVTNVTEVSDNHGYTVTLIGRPRFTNEALMSQLGLRNLPSLGYEATPLSFILDYFYALGPYLESLEVPSMFDFQGGSYTQKVTRVLTQDIRSAGGAVCKGNYVMTYVKRRLYTSFPVPIPPLSLRERSLTQKQSVNTGLVALQKLKALLT